MRILTKPGWDVAAGLATLAVMVLLAAHAGAQVLSTLFPEGVPGYATQPGVTVLSRNRSALEPPGIHAGTFLLSPRWEQAIGYDSNVLGGSSRKGSWVLAACRTYAHRRLMLES